MGFAHTKCNRQGRREGMMENELKKVEESLLDEIIESNEIIIEGQEKLIKAYDALITLKKEKLT